MKKIFNLLFIALLVVIYSACTPEEDNVFDQSSANRMTEAIADTRDLLTGVENGWLMAYYPSASQKYGGYNVLVSFTKDGKVTASSEVYDATDKVTSDYSLTQSAGVILSFDSYNDIIHFFSDPLNPAGIGDKGKGMEGDLEFRVMETAPDRIVMQGRKTGSRIVMTPMPKDASWSKYLNDVLAADDNMAFAAYKYEAGNVEASVVMSYHTMSMTYVENGVSVTVSVPYLVTPTGYKLYETLDLGGVPVDELTYSDAGDKYEFTSPQGNAKLFGLIPPLNQVLVTGSNWFFAYSKLSDYYKAKWDIAKEGLANDAGEELGQLFYSGGTLSFLSGTSAGFYKGIFSCSYTQEGEDKITIKITGYAETGNAPWYYTNVTGFPGLVNTIAGSFVLSADNLRNPTWIKLQDVNDASKSFVLSKSSISYPFDK